MFLGSYMTKKYIKFRIYRIAWNRHFHPVYPKSVTIIQWYLTTINCVRIRNPIHPFSLYILEFHWSRNVQVTVCTFIDIAWILIHRHLVWYRRTCHSLLQSLVSCLFPMARPRSLTPDCQLVTSIDHWSNMRALQQPLAVEQCWRVW